MSTRYKVVEGSQSCHCCFEYTVVDTDQPVMMHGKHYDGRFEPLCEAWNEEEANLICQALNALDGAA